MAPTGIGGYLMVGSECYCHAFKNIMKTDRGMALCLSVSLAFGVGIKMGLEVYHTVVVVYAQ